MNKSTQDKQPTTPERSEVNELLLRLGKEDPTLSYTELKSSPMGLTPEEVFVRINKYGKNEVAYTKPAAWWVQFFQSFASPFTLILIVIGITSYITDVYWAKDGGDWTKIVLIALMILLSGSLRFWQEFKSQKSAEKLKALVQNKVSVSRCEYKGGQRAECEQEANVSGLVPGDIVHLSAGDMIPADLRLISSNDFFIDESALTGESAPVEKFAKPITPSEEREAQKDVSTRNPLELNTLCFLGTNVVSGYAVGIVVATGDRTYFGSLAKNIVKERPLTSFDIWSK